MTRIKPEDFKNTLALKSYMDRPDVGQTVYRVESVKTLEKMVHWYGEPPNTCRLYTYKVVSCGESQVCVTGKNGIEFFPFENLILSKEEAERKADELVKKGHRLEI